MARPPVEIVNFLGELSKRDAEEVVETLLDSAKFKAMLVDALQEGLPAKYIGIEVLEIAEQALNVLEWDRAEGSDDGDSRLKMAKEGA